MWRRLADLAGIHEGEGGRALRLCALLLATTAALALLKGAQRGIFLASCDRARIPDAFMVSAACLAAASFVVAALAARVPVARLVQVVVAVAALAVVAVRLAVAPGRPAAALACYVVVEVISGVLLVQAWQVAAEVLDARAARRLLPVAGSAAGVAWTAGGFLVAPLARWLGAPWVLVAALPLLGASALAAAAIARHDLGGRAPRARRQAPHREVASAVAFVAVNRLARLIAVLSVVDLLVEQVLDYQLFTAAQAHYGADPAAIAGFSGRFYGVTGAITVLVPLFLSGRLLSRFGSPRCLLPAQVWVLFGSLLVLVHPGLAAVSALAGGDRVLKQSLSSPARAQMQSPIPAMRRAQTGALVRGVLAPLAYLAGGAVLKVATAHVAPRWTLVAAVALAVVLLAASGRAMRRAYQGALRDSLDQRGLDLGPGSEARGLALEREQCLALRETVQRGEEQRAAFAVTLLGDGDPAVAAPLLVEACEHPSAAVRAAAVEELAAFDRPEDIDVVSAVLERSPEDEVRRACLRALARLERKGCGDAVRRRDRDPDPRVRALARASLARAEEVGYGSLAWSPRGGKGDPDGETMLLDPRSRLARFADMLAAEGAAEREAAAWATGELRIVHPAVRAAFRRLLDDGDARVRAAALRASGRLGEPALLARVVDALDDAGLPGEAGEVLAEIPDRELAALAEPVARASPLVQGRVAAALAGGEGPAGDALLARLIASPHPVVRYRAARALAARSLRPGHRPPAREVVVAAVRAEVRLGHGYWAVIAGIARTDGVVDYEIEPAYRFLAGEVEGRVRQVTRRVLALLALVAPPRSVHAAEAGLASGDAARAARAVELLEHSLDPELAQLVLPLLEPRPLRLRVTAVPAAFAPPAGWLDDPVRAILALDDRHLRLAALTCHRERLAALLGGEFEKEERMLPLVERICFLRGVPLFRELAGEDVRRLAEIAGRVALPAGSAVFEKGDPAEELYIVADGAVDIRDGERVLARLRRNEVFGELAVLDGEPRSATAVCADDCELVTLRRADMEALLERRPQIAREIIRVLTRRLRDTNARLEAA